MKRKTALTLAALSAAIGFGTISSHAQDAKGMGGMMMGQGLMGDDCPMMDRMGKKLSGMMGGDMQAMADQRIAALKTQLAITPQQQTAWDTYAAALKKTAGGMSAMRDAMKTAMSTKSPVERLDAQVLALEARMAALKEVKPALANLYTSLSDEQKKKIDKSTGCMM